MNLKRLPLKQEDYALKLIEDVDLLNHGSIRTALFACIKCNKIEKRNASYAKTNKSGLCNSCSAIKVSHECIKTHGDSNTYLYRKWSDIKKRCYNHKSISYKWYGARGIQIYEEWKNDFQAFKAYVETLSIPIGTNLSLDRINNDMNYEPNNLRWTNQSIQVNNCRKLMITNSSGYRGVSVNKSGTFDVKITWNAKKSRHDKYGFTTALEAAIYRDSYIIANSLPNRLNHLKELDAIQIQQKSD